MLSVCFGVLLEGYGENGAAQWIMEILALNVAWAIVWDTMCTNLGKLVVTLTQTTYTHHGQSYES